MNKVILQSTFDDVVRENMCEFEMEMDDAIQDAVKQFEAQGINLQNIITDFIKYENRPTPAADGAAPASTSSSHPILLHLQILDRFSQSLSIELENEDKLVESLKVLEEQCNLSLAHRGLAEKQGAVQKLFTIFQHLMKHNASDSSKVACLDAFCALIRGQPDVVNKEVHLLYFIGILAKCKTEDGTMPIHASIICRIIRVLRLCCLLHEGHKQFIVIQGGIVPLLFHLLQLNRHQTDLVRESCLLLRTLTLDDDIRVEFSQAHDRAKAIVLESDALLLLLQLSKEFNELSDQAVVAEIFHTLGALSVRNEFCQQVLDHGGVSFLIAALQTHYKHANIASAAAALLKSLCGNDNVKVAVMTSGGMQILLQCIQFHITVESTVFNGCAAIAAASLRTPEAARVAVEEGNADQILIQVMEKYQKNANVFRQACLAVRNIVSRMPELSSKFLNAGVERLLNRPGLRLCSDEAKAALRDLGCSVELKEAWTGKGVALPQ